jgi:uncharacterized protein (UPF0548 family)
MLKKIAVAATIASMLSLVPAAHAAQPSTYQVTGPIIELTADTIVVKKGSERFEISRDATTKVTGDLKVGAKVTIQYRMTAASIAVAAEKAPAKKKAGA